MSSTPPRHQLHERRVLRIPLHGEQTLLKGISEQLHRPLPITALAVGCHDSVADPADQADQLTEPAMSAERAGFEK
jgi:hypothetical protein